MPLTKEQQAEVAAQRGEKGQTLRDMSPALEEMLYKPVPVLDHGFVRVIDYMGTDAAIVQAADDLYKDKIVSGATWKILSSRYNDAQMLDLVFAIGQYNLVSMALNTFGVQLDPGLQGFKK